MLLGARTAAWLPYDREVAYLESTSGGCYIDTGFVCDDTSGFSIDIMPYIGNANSRVIGSYCGTNGRWTFVFRANARDGGYKPVFYYGWNEASGDLSEDSVVVNSRFTAKLNYLNSRKLVVGSYDASLSGTLYSPQIYNAYLFGNNTNGIVNLSQTFAGRIYSATITRGNKKARDFIPVVKNNVGYMYDRVSGKLFGNTASSGAFTWAEKT